MCTFIFWISAKAKPANKQFTAFTCSSVFTAFTISAHKNVSCVRKQHDSKARTRGLFLESPDNWRARKAAIDYIQDKAFNSCSNNMIKQPVNITELNDLSARIHTFSSLDCVVPKYIPYLPDGGHFCFRLPTTLEFPFQGGACHTLPTPGISVIFQLGWVLPGKNISLKNVVAPYFYAKDNCFCDKARKIFHLC